MLMLVMVIIHLFIYSAGVIWLSRHWNHPRVLRAWQLIWHTDLLLVRTLSFQNKVRYCLVKPNSDGTLEGWLFRGSRQGKLVLLPQGVVDPDCDASFMYVWEHVDKQLKVAHILSQPDIISWTEWCQMDHLQKIMMRRKILDHAD
jgi:hypothetical protein